MRGRFKNLRGQSIHLRLHDGRTGVTVVRKAGRDRFQHDAVMEELVAGTVCGITKYSEVAEFSPWGPLQDPYPTLEAKLRALLSCKDREIRVWLKDRTNFACTVEDRVSSTAFCHEAIGRLAPGEVTRGGVTWFSAVTRVELRFRPHRRNAIMQEQLAALLAVKDRDVRVYMKDGSSFVCSVEDRVSDIAFCHEGVVFGRGETSRGGVTWFEQVQRVEMRFPQLHPNPTLESALLEVLRRSDRVIRVHLNDGNSFLCTVEDRVSPTAFCHESIVGCREPTRGGVTWFEQVNHVDLDASRP